MNKVLLTTSIIVSMVVVAGCGSANIPTATNTNTVTTMPEVDVALQGTWAGTGGSILGNNTIVEINITDGTIVITIDEPIEREVITAQYNVQSVEGAKFLLTLSQLTVDIEHYGSDSEATVNKRIADDAESYATSLSKITLDLENSDQMQFYPDDVTTDAIVLYRQ